MILVFMINFELDFQRFKSFFKMCIMCLNFFDIYKEGYFTFEFFGYLIIREYDVENIYCRENVFLQYFLVCIIVLKEMEVKIFKYIKFLKLLFNNI